MQSVKYAFNQEQLNQIEAARLVFNRFTGSDLNIQQYIHFIISDAITSEKRAADLAARLMQDVSGKVVNFRHPQSIAGVH